jgi:hypothetical protein
MTRDEHLRWAKDRALEYVDAGELNNAFASMGSDLQKHPELRNHPGWQLAVSLKMAGHMPAHEMRAWIEGFN